MKPMHLHDDWHHHDKGEVRKSIVPVACHRTMRPADSKIDPSRNALLQSPVPLWGVIEAVSSEHLIDSVAVWKEPDSAAPLQ